MKINSLDMEWTNKGCVVKVTGFDGVMMTCPQCQELLPRDVVHRCGDKAIKKRARRCIDCDEGPCDMNCGPATTPPPKKTTGL